MKTLLALVPLLALVSCQPENETPVEKPEPPPVSAPAINLSDTASLVGLPLEKVQAACDAADVAHRIIELDGEPQMVTRDHRPDRLNFAVKDGIITEVTKG